MAQAGRKAGIAPGNPRYIELGGDDLPHLPVHISNDPIDRCQSGNVIIPMNHPFAMRPD
jgi:hypothetical protein